MAARSTIVIRFKKAFNNSFFFRSACSAVLGFVIFFLYITIHSVFVEKKLARENERMTTRMHMVIDSLNFYNQYLDAVATRDNRHYRFATNLDSIPHQLRDVGFGGANPYASLNGYDHCELIGEVLTKLTRLDKKCGIQKRSYREISRTLSTKNERSRQLPVLPPVHTKDITRYCSDYGYRISPITGKMQFHKGIDLTCQRGKNVYASGAGTVSFAGSINCGYGKYIVIEHGASGFKTVYAHLSAISVTAGDTIQRGIKIGNIGNTGSSTAPHLHYEIHVDRRHVNPDDFLIPLSVAEYDALLQTVDGNDLL
ncbi:MAG: M23 family metallopeptidase [Bacteroidota bacterium]